MSDGAVTALAVVLVILLLVCGISGAVAVVLLAIVFLALWLVGTVCIRSWRWVRAQARAWRRYVDRRIDDDNWPRFI